jgi:hypothetical protein
MENTNALILTRARALVKIETQQQADDASAVLAEISQVRKAIKAEFEPMIKSASAALDAVRKRFREADYPLEQAEKSLRGALADFAERERLRAEEEARKQAEEAAKRIEERIEEELDSVTDPELARAILDRGYEELNAVMAAPAPPKPATSAATFREVWRGRVVNVRELCRAIADGRAPESLVEVRMSEVNKLASVHREQLSTLVPGLQAFKQTVTTVKAVRA